MLLLIAMTNSKEKIILFLILGLALILRVVGVGYGLPLQLHDDEAPFILAALKMIQLKTVLPVLHMDEFKPILFYLPYASYLYLPFFLVYMAFAGLYGWATGTFPIASLQDFLLSDLSPFFLIARLMSVLAGITTIYFVYRAGRQIFNEKIGLMASFLLATSLLHITLSISARHWIWLGLIIAAVLAILTWPDWSFKKRYLCAVIVAGLGAGFNIMSVVALIIIIAHYFLIEKRHWREMLSDKFIYGITALFVVLVALPIMLYPAGLGFGVDVSVGSAKTFTDALKSFYYFLWPIGVSEPILSGVAILGLVLLFIKRDRFAWVATLFIVLYVLIFYFGFYFAHRFVLGLYPVLAILGGYGVWEIWRFLSTLRINYLSQTALNVFAMTILIMIFALPMVAALRLDYLAVRGDAKSLAREWMEENIGEEARVIVAAKRTRLSTTKNALLVQEKLDQSSIRRSEVAEVSFQKNPHNYKSFNAVNLDAVGNEEFYNNVDNYIKESGFEYLLISPDDLTASRRSSFYEATRHAELLVYFGSQDENYSLTKAQFKGFFTKLFKMSEFGSMTAIYKF